MDWIGLYKFVGFLKTFVRLVCVDFLYGRARMGSVGMGGDGVGG